MTRTGRRLPTRRERVALTVAAVLGAVAIVAIGSVSDRFGDAPLFLLVVPLALAALAYGVRGGLALGFLSSALVAVWWIDHDSVGGGAWLVARSLAALLFGGLLGWFVDSREGLVREIEKHAELSLDLVATASFEGYFTRVNPAFTRTLGYSAEELTSRPFLDFVHPDDLEPTLQAVADQTEEGRDVLNFQNRYRTKDGAYRWLEWTSHPDARAHSLIAIARDVTDRKRLEALEAEHTHLLEAAVRDRTEELRERNEELEEARREILLRLALAAEFRDEDTFEHIDRVGRGAALLATELQLPPQTVELIRDAAPLHDLGKIGVSDTILLKPGKLTREEHAAMKRHTVIGSALLAGSASDVLRMAEEIALNHHEWWDGSGYPARAAGDTIPITARIVAVVDVFDALTHNRPYKPAWPVEQAVEEMHRLRGSQFDPAVVDAFDRLDPYALADLHPEGRRAVA